MYVGGHQNKSMSHLDIIGRVVGERYIICLSIVGCSPNVFYIRLTIVLCSDHEHRHSPEHESLSCDHHWKSDEREEYKICFPIVRSSRGVFHTRLTIQVAAVVKKESFSLYLQILFTTFLILFFSSSSHNNQFLNNVTRLV